MDAKKEPSQIAMIWEESSTDKGKRAQTCLPVGMWGDDCLGHCLCGNQSVIVPLARGQW
jgi:hypothetical protein